ncbi:hypothetical protein GOP47_0026451 [Adiantum capillus-veneris]|nr:hypothetical protein GOP47_0026451 [Adiantum capillus-veneris]
MSTLACVDLQSRDVAASVERLRKACLDCGFFYIVNHGISPVLMQQVFQQSKNFFSLPLEEKAKSLRNENHRGYTPFLDETLDPAKQSKGDCKEGYYLGIELPKDLPRSSIGFYGANIWPSEELVPGWRDTMERYHAEAMTVGHKVASLVALALNLEEDFFKKPGMMDYPIAVLRLLHYSGEMSIPDDGIFGAGAHSDWGLLTLLACDGTPGLQICKDKHAEPRTWENVQPIEGAFVVNLGDMLERWSNNIFQSTLHRVMTSGKERYSIAFFVDPNYECMVECLETCTSKDNPPKFPPIRSGEYLLSRYGETHAKMPASLLSFEAGNIESVQNCVQ